jgi:hypothetical protein
LLTFDLSPYPRFVEELASEMESHFAATLKRLHDAELPSPAGGWSYQTMYEFIIRLARSSRYDRIAVIEAAAATGGFIDRASALEVSGRGPDESLNGYTKPILGAKRYMVETGQIAADALDPLEPTYDGTGPDAAKATGFRVPAELVELIRAVAARRAQGRSAALGM